MTKHTTSFIRNTKGQVVLWQSPNFALWSWIVLTVFAKFVADGRLQDGLQHTAQAFLFVWAYMEVRTGESQFRQLLGGVVFTSIIVAFFNV
jgi:hypothetical protein